MTHTVTPNIRRIYAHSVFTQMLFALPVIIPYYQTIGLGFREFLIGEAVFSAVVLVAEVPSGWLSDLWRRRTVLMLGALFGMAGLTTLLLAEGFWGATIGQAIVGIAVALNSGTNTALLYDTLHEAGRESEYRRIEGNRHGYGIYGTGLACLCGGVLFTVHPKLPLLLDVLVLLAAMIAIAGVREPVRYQRSVEKTMFRDMAATVRYALSGHPEITGIIMVSTVMLCTTKLMLWAQQPYYQMLGIPVAWFGVILTAMYAGGGFAGQHGHRLDRMGSNRAALGLALTLLCGACVILAFTSSVWIALPLFFIGILGYAMGQPRVHNAINIRVGPERRATILSTASLMVHILFIPASMVVGALTERGGIQAGLMYMAGQIVVLGGIGLIFWARKDRTQKTTVQCP